MRDGPARSDPGGVKERLYIAAALVLAAGLAAGAVLYFNGGEAEGEGGSYIVANGVAYHVPAHMEKTYVRDLQRFGGKASVLFDEFGTWFAGLWRGKTLGLTVIWLSVSLAALLVLIGVRS